jgi:hypothetical protein
MKLTKDQTRLFWSLWRKARQVQGWTTTDGYTEAQATNERYAMLERAGFSSLTDVDPLEGFTRVKRELALLIADVEMVSSTTPEADQRRKLLHRIAAESAVLGTGYFERLARDRFGVVPGLRPIEDLPTRDLLNFARTLRSRRKLHTPPATAPPAEVAAESPF